MNKTILLKWLWIFGNEHGTLWRQVIASKYGMTNAWGTKIPTSPQGVGCWKGIIQLVEDFKTEIRIEVGNGRKHSVLE